MSLYSNDFIRKNAEEMVERNVIYCVSTLIGAIANPESGYGRRSIGTEEVCSALSINYEEELLPLLESNDWEQAACWHIQGSMDIYELREYLRDQGVEFVEPEEDDDGDELPETGTQIDELRSLAVDAASAEGFEDFCNEFDLEPERCEVYEHWIVSYWLGRKLADKGHPLVDICSLNVWGRSCTGQAISMDHDILEIAREVWGEGEKE